MKSPRFQRLHRVSHHDRRAGEFEHLEVVEVVADGHHLLALEAERAAQLSSACPLVAWGS
jgi:hypothetical protein